MMQYSPTTTRWPLSPEDTTQQYGGSELGVSTVDRRCFADATRKRCMDDRDLLGIVLAGIALMMFVTGIVLVM